MLGSLDRLLLALAPAARRRWIAGMLREAQHLPPRDQIGWYIAAARLAAAARIAQSIIVQSIALAIVMLAVDWVWGALIPALVLIALSAALIRKGPAAFAVAAGTLPIAHAVANWIPPLRPSYQFAPLDFHDWITLAAVGGVGACAVKIADALRRLNRT